MIMSVVLSSIPRNMITVVDPSALFAVNGIPNISHTLSVALRLVSHSSVELVPIM